MKKLLLILLIILPSVVYADSCYITEFLEYASAENNYKTPTYQTEIRKKVDGAPTVCKRGSVLVLTIQPPNNQGSIHFEAERLIFDSIAEYCDFNKTIVKDIEGQMLNLTCVMK